MLSTQVMPGAMIIVPELEWYRTLNWTNNLLALGLVYAAFSVPLGSWILKRPSTEFRTRSSTRVSSTGALNWEP
jgi:ABC-type glycerol-3-phosphate transport system permease component